MNAVIDKWMVDGVLTPFKPIQEPTPKDMRKPLYCRYRRYVGHGTRDCKAIWRTFHKKISYGTLNLTREQEVQRNPLPHHHRRKATATVLFHNRADETETASDTSIPPAAISALQRSPTFRTLFNQLGLMEESRRAATKALVSIIAGSETHCLTAEAHASRAFLETTNVITFIDEDMEVQHPDHSKPLYIAAQINDVQIRRALVDTGASLNLVPTSTLKAAGTLLNRIVGALIEVFGFVGIHEYTIGSIQLVLKAGPLSLSPDFMLSTHPFLIILYLGSHSSINISLCHLLTTNVSKEDSMVSLYASLLVLHHLIYPKHITLRLLSMMSSPQVGKILLQSLLGFLYPAGKTLTIILRYT